MPGKLFSRVLCALLVLLLCLSFLWPFLPGAAADLSATRYCYTNSSINFRSSPYLESSNTFFTFARHQVLPVVGQAHGASVYGSTLWYRVTYTRMTDGVEYVGYVHSSLVTLCPEFDTATAEFSEFPASYRPYLAALKAAHPNWNFYPLNTGKDWASMVASQAAVTTSGSTLTSPSFVSANYSSIYRSTEVVGGLNASTTLLDGGTRYCANAATVAYYLDPRNFLSDIDVFMFADQGYDPAIHTLASVENMIKGTYMEYLKTPNNDGVEVSYAQAFLDAAVATGISPYYLLITSFTENGTSGTNLSKGNLQGGVCKNAECADESHRGYYNFFGIGSTPEGSPQHNGLLYAMEKGWNTAYKAILGGAAFQGDSYITKGQQTPYLKKFNVNPASPYGIWHQYMQNLTHPESEALLTFRSLADNGLLEMSHEFLIPVYDNMPQTPCALPNQQTYIPGSGAAAPTTASFTSSFDCDYDACTIRGVLPGTTEAALRAGFSLGEGTTMTLSSSRIGTGTLVQICYGGAAVYSFQVVIRGDISGNGGVEALDLLYLRDYLLGSKELASSYLAGADVDSNGVVNSLDLLKLRDANLGIYTISQKG